MDNQQLPISPHAFVTYKPVVFPYIKSTDAKAFIKIWTKNSQLDLCMAGTSKPREEQVADRTLNLEHGNLSVIPQISYVIRKNSYVIGREGLLYNLIPM